MQPIFAEIEVLLLRGAFRGNPCLVDMCRELHRHCDWLWTFVEIGGIEPTNNASDRTLRHAFIWRWLSLSTQSPAGSRFVETILTVVETSRQVLAYIATAVETRLARQPAPSLLFKA